MTRMVAQRWWRRSALALLVGSAAVAALPFAMGQPVRTTPGGADLQWTRSPTTYSAPSQEPPMVAKVVPAAGVVPPVPTWPPVKPVPAVAGPSKGIPDLPSLDSPLAVPKKPLSNEPILPEWGAATKPVAPPVKPAPQAPLTVPESAATATTPPTEFVAPRPTNSVSPSHAPVAPSAPPLKFAESAPPLPVGESEFNLRQPEARNTLNLGSPSGTEKAAKPVLFPPDLGPLTVKPKVGPLPASVMKPIEPSAARPVTPMISAPIAKAEAPKADFATVPSLALPSLEKPAEPTLALPIPVKPAETLEWAPPKPVDPIVTKPATPGKPALVAPGVSLDVPPPMDLAPATPPSTTARPIREPALTTTTAIIAKPEPPVLTPGDSAMKRSLTQAAMAALLGGAVTLSPTQAQEPAKADEALAKQLIENNKLLSEIREELRDMKAIRERIFGRKDEKGFPVESDPGLIIDIRRLNDRVEDLRKSIEGMKSQTIAQRPTTPATTPPASTDPTPSTKITLPSPMPSTTPGVSAYAPSVVAPAVASKGTLRLVNDYPVEISMVINDKQSYQIGPHAVKSVEVPAGDFSYQLLQGGSSPVKSVIKEKETVTLRVK